MDTIDSTINKMQSCSISPQSINTNRSSSQDPIWALLEKVAEKLTSLPCQAKKTKALQLKRLQQQKEPKLLKRTGSSSKQSKILNRTNMIFSNTDHTSTRLNTLPSNKGLDSESLTEKLSYKEKA